MSEHPRHGRGHRWRIDRRGLSNSVQWAVLFPVVLLCTLGIIQAGVWIHGRNVAVEAANTAADIARGRDADPAAAQSAAMRVAAVGGLVDVGVQLDRDPSRVAVTVDARVPMFLDLGLARISEHAQAPVERVTGP